MTRPLPPRLRENITQQGERARIRRKRIYLIVIPLLAIPVLLLTYGLVERTLVRPRVDATVEQTDMYVKAGEHIQVNVVNA